jgi:hypothetical protein
MEPGEWIRFSYIEALLPERRQLGLKTRAAAAYALLEASQFREPWRFRDMPPRRELRTGAGGTLYA